jgi:hypothetical protein
MTNEQLKRHIHNEIANATVKILEKVDKGYEFRGTGFFIMPDGYLLTAYHCLKEIPLDDIFVETRFDGKFKAVFDEQKSLQADKFDIAVLKVDDYRPSHYLPLGTVTNQNITDEIVALGYPAGHRPDNQDIGTYLGNISRFRDDNRIENDAMKGKGQSGGSVYHYATSRVIGITLEGYHQDVIINAGLAARFEPLFDKWTELAAINQDVATAWENKLRVVSATQNAIHHRIFYTMLPDHPDYQPLVATLREVVEDRWGCQLLLASDRHYGENMLDNVRAHLEQASAFIAEVTAADPNVMFELGAVRFYLHHLPILLLAQSAARLPKDLQGHILIEYDNISVDNLADYLDEQMQRNDSVKRLLDDSVRERYLSAAQLKRLSRFKHLSNQVFQNLAEHYPTQEAWLHVSEADIKPYLGRDDDLAGALIKRVRDKV